MNVHHNIRFVVCNYNYLLCYGSWPLFGVMFGPGAETNPYILFAYKLYLSLTQTRTRY